MEYYVMDTHCRRMRQRRKEKSLFSKTLIKLISRNAVGAGSKTVYESNCSFGEKLASNLSSPQTGSPSQVISASGVASITPFEGVEDARGQGAYHAVPKRALLLREEESETPQAQGQGQSEGAPKVFYSPRSSSS
jgi:hypothetical protein